VIISRTPLRISFCGGGSDLPSYYRHEFGAVVTSAINKYIYIAVNPKFDHKIRASYSKTEIVDCVDDLNHELIREALRFSQIKGGIEITSISDIPSNGSGLGSSSTYTVGLLNALYSYKGIFAGAERLAYEACQIEIERCKKPIGKQDQYIAAYGGLQYIRFNHDESVHVDPIICTQETRRVLADSLLLLYTGIGHNSGDILKEQNHNLDNRTDTRPRLKSMVELAEQTRQALQANDLRSFGEALHIGWINKRQLAKCISNPEIDDWYQRGRNAGALGGKLLGAGGGGFLLLFAPPDRHEAIRMALPELRAIPFRFEQQGSKIIYVEENG
jgi:D-glycero-alpha-D-manno-heptose-7-phosphate kinase